MGRQFAAAPDPASVAGEVLALAGVAPEELDAVRFSGPETVLPSSYAVTCGAQALVAAVCVAIANLARGGSHVERTPITIDSTEACTAFQSERHLRLNRPVELWDELSGHYRAKDGHIQFHTNFVHHRQALLRATGCENHTGRDDVAAVVATIGRFEMEERMAETGGIAAALRTLDEWAEHPQRAHVTGRPPLQIARSDTESGSGAGSWALGPIDRPLAGLRVLDCTRVIAGPVCSRTLAAYGADVLRLGAPDLPVVDSILPDTTLGKRFAHADLTTAPGRDTVLRLAAEADVMVVGYRPGALAGYGLGPDQLFDANPNLVLATLSAFGSDGPWGGKRGFDSITQTATGVVAAETEAFGSDRPRPLPCQFLDHGTGFFLALGVLSALADQRRSRGGRTVDASLLTTRNWLASLGTTDPGAGRQLTDADVSQFLETRSSSFGPVTHVRHPGQIEGIPARWEVGPSKPGQHQPEWATPRPSPLPQRGGL